MFNNIKNMFSEETEMLDDRTSEIEVIGNEKDFEDDSFAINSNFNGECTIIRIYIPVSKTLETTIINAIKSGDVCIVDYKKLHQDEATALNNSLRGAVTFAEGVYKKLKDDMFIYASEKYIIDSSSVEEL